MCANWFYCYVTEISCMFCTYFIDKCTTWQILYISYSVWLFINVLIDLLLFKSCFAINGAIFQRICNPILYLLIHCNVTDLTKLTAFVGVLASCNLRLCFTSFLQACGQLLEQLCFAWPHSAVACITVFTLMYTLSILGKMMMKFMVWFTLLTW